jgi:DNA mismatch repair protein MutS
VLARLEKTDRRAAGQDNTLDDLPLFAAALPKGTSAKADPSPVESALDSINPDELSPRAALEALYRLKELRAGAKAEDR